MNKKTISPKKIVFLFCPIKLLAFHRQYPHLSFLKNPGITSQSTIKKMIRFVY